MSTKLSAALRVERRTIYRGIASLAAVTVLLATTACKGGDSGTAPQNQDPSGVYGLVQIDNKAIPFEIFNGPYYDEGYGGTYPLSITVVGGTAILTAGGHFHVTINRAWSSEGDTGTSKSEIDGTYEIQGTTIAIDTDMGSGKGTYKNRDITLTLDVGETGTMRKYVFRLVR